MKAKPNSQILNLFIPIVLLLSVLPMLQVGDFDPSFKVKIGVVMPPLQHSLDIGLPPLEMEKMEPETMVFLNVLVDSECYYVYQMDYKIIPFSYWYKIEPIGEIPKIERLGRSALMKLLEDHQENCPEYPIKIVIHPDARVGQMAEMLVWMRRFRVARYRLDRISEIESCLVEELDAEREKDKSLNQTLSE